MFEQFNFAKAVAGNEFDRIVDALISGTAIPTSIVDQQKKMMEAASQAASAADPLPVTPPKRHNTRRATKQLAGKKRKTANKTAGKK